MSNPLFLIVAKNQKSEISYENKPFLPLGSPRFSHYKTILLLYFSNNVRRMVSMTSLPQKIARLYPFQSHFFTLNEPKTCRLHYIDEGKGEIVVMLHGNPTWSFYYRNLVLHLKSDYRCLVPDHIGCGLSDKPQHYPYCLQRHIDNTLQWLKGMQVGRFHLVVHDWGGAVGMGIATRWPASVRSITILNSAAFLSQQMPLRIALCRTKIGSWAIRYWNVFAKAATVMAVKTPLSPDVKFGYLYPYDSPQHRVAIDRFVQDIPVKESHPTRKVLKNIQDHLWLLTNKPCLIAWGMRDFCFTPEFLSVWQRYFPNAECYPFQNAGHYVLEDAKEEILPIIRRFIVKNTEV